jgi:hypothetical protein
MEQMQKSVLGHSEVMPHVPENWPETGGQEPGAREFCRTNDLINAVDLGAARDL